MVTALKNRIPKLPRAFSNQPRAIFIGIFAILGLYLLLNTFAAATTANLQAEEGTKAGVNVGVDASAANGGFIQFGTGAADGIYNDDDIRIGYAGTWAISTGAGRYLDNDHYSATTDSTATFSFSGTQVSVYGAKASHHGIAGISIDNDTEVLADYYSATRADNVQVFQSAVLTAGSHTIRLRVTGTKNAASTGNYITLDRIVVGADSGTPPPQPPPPPSGNRIGVTLTHNSVDYRNPNLWNTMTGELKTDKWLMNTHVHGFGVVSPTIDNYQTLDARIKHIHDAGGEPVITLCCATAAQQGTGGDYDYLAPAPANYDAYAQMSANIASRYPEVKYFQVWNEMKGFYRTDFNRWNYEAYTDLYNKIYTKVKQVRPDALVGGPYPPMESWTTANFSHPSSLRGIWGVMDQRPMDVITYWLAHKVGADFVTMDGGGCPTASKNPQTYSCDGMTEIQRHDYFKDTAAWVRTQTNLPIWWAEFYPTILQTSGETYRTNMIIDAFTKFQQGGGSVALLWMEECSDANFAFANIWGCDGSFYPAYYSLKNGYN